MSPNSGSPLEIGRIVLVLVVVLDFLDPTAPSGQIEDEDEDDDEDEEKPRPAISPLSGAILPPIPRRFPQHAPPGPTSSGSRCSQRPEAQHVVLVAFMA